MAANLDKLFSGLVTHSDVFATVGAEDVLFARQETSANQRHAAPFAVEAVVVPLALLKRNVLASPETADRGGAVSTFLSKQVAEAVEAVGKVVPRGEALAGQLLLAPDANEALLMPGLVTVVHSSSGDGLLAVDTLQSKQLLIAGQAVVVGFLLDKALGANGLLATVAGETILMPTVALMLHLFRAWHDGLQARMALGRVLIAVALGTQQRFILGGKRPLHKRSAALDAEKAFAVPVAVLVRQILAGAANELFAHFTVVGEEFLIALNAVWAFVPQNVLLPIQGLLTLCTVVGLDHLDSNLLCQSSVLSEEESLPVSAA